MSNSYGIPDEIEKKIRAKDRTEGSIEHFNNRWHFEKEWNVAICCRGCNSSKGTKTLLTWFKSPYCVERKISKATVAGPVKKFISERLRTLRAC
jgi:hypothetical protein